MTRLTPELIDSAAHCFVSSLDYPVLDDEDAHHVHRVLRIRDGERITCSDGAGRWRSCRVDHERLVVDGDIADGPSAVPLTVAFGVPKGDRPEQIVQHLTELGVARIVPLSSDRTVVRWDESKAQAHVERWRRVARQAAMQSRRCTLPVLDRLHRADEVFGGAGVYLAVPGTEASPTAVGDCRVVMIGPEGGWSGRELELAATLGVARVGLGDTVLRVETACLTAALLCAPR